MRKKMNLGKEHMLLRLRILKRVQKVTWKTSKVLPFLTIEETNQDFIWGQNYVLNVFIACMHPIKDA
jgi:hypothetical protein